MVKQFYLIYKWTLSGFITLGESRPGSNVSEGVLHIPQSSWTGALPSDGLETYPEHSVEEESLTSQQRCSWCILQPQSTRLCILVISNTYIVITNTSYK